MSCMHTLCLLSLSTQTENVNLPRNIYMWQKTEMFLVNIIKQFMISWFHLLEHVE